MRNAMKIGALTAAATVGLMILAWVVWQASAQTTQGGLGTSPAVSVTGMPPGTEALAVQWVQVAVPGVGVMVAAVAHPSGAGPFPTVLLLHGSHGFAHEYVRLAQDLAEGGLLAMAACWFQGGGGAGARFITPISCPEASPMPNASSPEAMQAARTLPGARPDRIGLFGHSRGGEVALHYTLQVGNVQAAVRGAGHERPEGARL
jgi:dienelactone hydrolase